jgi:hypothetical protein
MRVWARGSPEKRYARARGRPLGSPRPQQERARNRASPAMPSKVGRSVTTGARGSSAPAAYVLSLAPRSRSTRMPACVVGPVQAPTPVWGPATVHDREWWSAARSRSLREPRPSRRWEAMRRGRHRRARSDVTGLSAGSGAGGDGVVTRRRPVHSGREVARPATAGARPEQCPRAPDPAGRTGRALHAPSRRARDTG